MIHTQCLLTDNIVFEQKYVHENKKAIKIKQHMIITTEKIPRDPLFFHS